MPLTKKIRYNLRIHNELVREMLAEFLGTFVLGAFVFGWNAEVVLKRNLNHNISAGIGLCIAIIIAGQVSGGHMNPVITLSFCLMGKIKFKKLLPYTLAQTLGAFIVASLQYGILYDSMSYQSKTEGSNIDFKNHIFSSFPPDDVSIRSAVLNQIIAAFLLVIGILAITDTDNIQYNPIMLPITVGILLTAIIASFSLNECAINPAIDVAGRILLAAISGNSTVFSYRNYSWFCVPVFLPLVGSVLAVAVYNGFICIHRPEILTITAEFRDHPTATTAEIGDTKF
ncbi:aquaporin-9-like isoform X2 [Octopus sinensis]|uniref:Aquaporin-9-like isoform X2 n=1 Tax=Octopus sinensis TaxID=2607531 RepID=A0A7E6EN85_9MOLL|nr:aquaporin-9-like isoform X2 [Octopus sinensis]